MKTTLDNINQIEATIDAALEHASFAWHRLESDTIVNRLNPDMWPPRVDEPVGSMAYHWAASVSAMHRAYQIIREEQDRLKGINSPNTQ